MEGLHCTPLRAPFADLPDIPRAHAEGVQEGWLHTAVGPLHLHPKFGWGIFLTSVVPSVEDFTLHKLCFGSFLIFSVFFLLHLSIYLGILLSSMASWQEYWYSMLRKPIFSSSCHRISPGSHLDRQALYYKKVLLMTNVLLLATQHLFWAWVYSIVSVFEYTVVLSNMATSHLTMTSTTLRWHLETVSVGLAPTVPWGKSKKEKPFCIWVMVFTRGCSQTSQRLEV